MLIAGSIVLGIVIVCAITAFTGYFVAQEFAFMAVDRSRLAARAESGDSGAARALQVTRRTSFMLSGAQLGITVTGLLVGYVAEPLIGQGLGQALGGGGVPTAIAMAIGAVVAILFSTVVQMVFGELFPKNLAIARPEPVALRLARSTNVYLGVFGWLIKMFDAASNLLLKALRIEPVHDVEHSATARDLEHIVAESREAGELPPDLSILLDRILDFPTRTAEHAMIPRSRVDVLDADVPSAEVIARMAAGHTRYPVVGIDQDGLTDVVGVVDLHDLLDPDVAGTAGTLAQPAVVVPETLTLNAVVTELAEARQEMAIVIDEYGGFVGVLTIEDLAEELVGEIADEHDNEPEAFAVTTAEDGWLISGNTPLDEIDRTVGIELPEGDYETIAGLVIAAHEGLPDVGDAVDVALAPEPDTLLDDGPTRRRSVRIEVRTIERRVPATVFMHTPLASEVTGDE